jgi:spore coat polysaccharide biosynthesis predicted glycosyltransferase SpsG
MIGAGGSTNWERCCLGLPAIVLCLDENQQAVSQGLRQLEVAYYLGELANLSQASLREAINYFREERNLTLMSKKAFSLVDGKGCQRVIQKLIDHRHKKQPGGLHIS